MGRRGPKTKPTILKILAGNPGKRPLPENEPHAKPGLPRCPNGMSAEGKRVWRALGKQLADCGIVTQTDGPAFELLVAAYLEWHEAAKKVAATGPIWLEQGQGKIPKFAYSPYWVQSQRAQKQLLAILREFGMTPSARTGVKVLGTSEQEESADPAVKYFA